METTSFVATTFSGLEPILAEELIAIGATDVEMMRRAVGFSGDEDILYRANYLSRLSLRILKPFRTFKASSPQELYDQSKRVDWMKLFDVGNTFLIDPVATGQIFKHSQYAAQKVKDAIADQFRDRFGQRPNVDIENPQIRIHLRIHEDQCTLSLDSSGESLHRRGYKMQLGHAPLSEVLACGMLKLAGWDSSKPLYDPMCGSGTLLTEASMIAREMPPGFYRKSYSFMNWPDYSRMRWIRIKKEADEKISPWPEDLLIRGSDINPYAIDWALENLKSVGADSNIQLEVMDFTKSIAPWQTGLMITNPPYGVRLKSGDIASLYRQFGDVLKSNYKGWSAWLFSSDLNALKQTGLKPSKSLVLFNGPLECRFAQYDIRTSVHFE